MRFMDISREQLPDIFQDITEAMPVGSKWRHFKGGIYQIIEYALYMDMDIPVAIYRDEPDAGHRYTSSQERWFTSVQRSDNTVISRYTRLE